MDAAQSRQQTAPGALTAFARFVLCGGGVGLASSFAVVGLAAWIPWALANAVITVVSTLLATELHARFTFGAGGRATWRQHAQSAGSAAAAYAVTCAAMLALYELVAAPGAVLEQAVYLSASALAGVARFAVLRLVVFARNHARTAVPDSGGVISSDCAGTAPSRPCPASVSPPATSRPFPGARDGGHRPTTTAPAARGRRSGALHTPRCALTQSSKAPAPEGRALTLPRRRAARCEPGHARSADTARVDGACKMSV